jgi:hypothetical protein
MDRVDRRRARQVVASALGPVELAAAEQAEVALHAKKSMWLTKRWRKWPDAPLRDTVIYKLRRRAQRGMLSPADIEARVACIRRRIG